MKKNDPNTFALVVSCYGGRWGWSLCRMGMTILTCQKTFNFRNEAEEDALSWRANVASAEVWYE